MKLMAIVRARNGLIRSLQESSRAMTEGTDTGGRLRRLAESPPCRPSSPVRALGEFAPLPIGGYLESVSAASCFLLCPKSQWIEKQRTES